MRISLSVALALVPSIAAIVIQAPDEITAGEEYNITWTADSDLLVLYLTEDREPPLYPIAVAATSSEGTTVKYPNVKLYVLLSTTVDEKTRPTY